MSKVASNIFGSFTYDVDTSNAIEDDIPNGFLELTIGFPFGGDHSFIVHNNEVRNFLTRLEENNGSGGLLIDDNGGGYDLTVDKDFGIFSSDNNHGKTRIPRVYIDPLIDQLREIMAELDA